MPEPVSIENEPIIETLIQTENTGDNQAAEALLATLDLEQLARHTLRTVHVDPAVTLTLVICGDHEIQALNRQYRRQDQPTDVLSFPLLDKPLVTAPADYLWQPAEEIEEEGERVATPAFITPAELRVNLGDILISWPTMRRQAAAAGQTDTNELRFLFCHGLLHLLGYDDQTTAGYTEMIRLQKEILSSGEREV